MLADLLSFLPPLVASYDPRGDTITWLCRCWHVSFAHGSALAHAMMSPPFTPRTVADVDVVLCDLVKAGWVKPGERATPDFNQAVLYIQHGGKLCGGGRTELMKLDAHTRKHGHTNDGFREWRFYGYEPVRTCEPYRSLVIAEMKQGAA